MIKIEQVQDKDIYSFTIGKTISEADSQEFIDFLELHADDGNKVNLIGIINNLPGFEDFSAFTATLKMKTKAIGAIAKYAVLTDKSWLESAVSIGNFFTPGIPMKHFHLNEMQDAIVWLESNEH